MSGRAFAASAVRPGRQAGAAGDAGGAGAPQAEPLLSFVLPIATDRTGRDDRDMARARLLLASLDRFLDRSVPAGLLVVTPPGDLAAARAAVAGFEARLRIAVVAETELCPELARDPDTRNLWPRPNTGWFRQQLIKLAAHAHVPTPFYMTLDADVVFVRPFGVADLIADGRALLGTVTEADFTTLLRPEVAAHEVEVRRRRIEQAEAVLRLRRPEGRDGLWYGETPALLSRDIVADMARHLEAVWQTGWRDALLQRLPWTEYALYGLYAEATGLLERHHRGGPDAVLRLGDSLWRPAEDYLAPRSLDAWDIGRAFRDGAEGIAVVVQSYLGYAVADVAGRIAPRLR